MNFPFGQYAHLAPSDGDIDILDTIGPVDRIGIQGPPGMEFFLNNEPMHIGRTGLFEIETTIDKFTINGKNKFIVDYHIKTQS